MDVSKRLNQKNLEESIRPVIRRIIKMSKKINCKHRQEIQTDKDAIKYCQLATDASGTVCKVSDNLCESCLSLPSSGTESSAIVQLLVESGKKDKQIANDMQKSDELIGHGVGTELKRMIPDFLESPNCSCKDFAKKMNIWGIEGCEQRRERIVDRLVKESKKRPIFKWTPEKMTRYVSDRMLTAAIGRAKQNE